MDGDDMGEENGDEGVPSSLVTLKKHRLKKHRLKKHRLKKHRLKKHAG